MGRKLSEFCHALAYRDLCEEIVAARSDPGGARPVDDITREIVHLKANGYRTVIGIGALLGVT